MSDFEKHFLKGKKLKGTNASKQLGKIDSLVGITNSKRWK